MPYVDGFVIPLPKKNVARYTAIAKKASKLFREFGALEVRECLLDDPASLGGVGFPKGARARRNETVLFSYVVYRSKAHRDAVNAKLMKDPRMSAMMGDGPMLFDMKRFLYGGFRSIVSA